METLKIRRDFLQLRAEGKVLKAAPYFFLNYSLSSQSLLRIGFTAKRNVACAVDRNKLRRWVKSYYRSSDHVGLDINVVLKKNKDDKFYRNLKHSKFLSDLQATMHKLEKRL